MQVQHKKNVFKSSEKQKSARQILNSSIGESLLRYAVLFITDNARAFI